MKKLTAFLLSASLVAASGATATAAPAAPGACYDSLGRQTACDPRYEGRSQATTDDIDPLWIGGGLLLLGGGIAGAIAATSGSGGGGNIGGFPLVFPTTPASP